MSCGQTRCLSAPTSRESRLAANTQMPWYRSPDYERIKPIRLENDSTIGPAARAHFALWPRPLHVEGSAQD